MSLHITDREVKKLIKQLGYKGCKNCKNQIEPLRMCEWGEQGGDRALHFICSRWSKKEVSN